MLTKPIAVALAALAHELRPSWDEPGLMAALGKCVGRHEHDVAMALVRFCADPGAQTPGAFPNPTGPHWTERVSPAATGRRNPPRGEECPDHVGEWRINCRCCAADRKAKRDADDTARREQTRLTTADALAAARAALATAKAGQCALHHAVVCTECDRAKATTTKEDAHG